MPDTVITNPTPQTRFKEIPKAIAEHRDLMQMPRTQRALDYAMLQYQKELAERPFNESSATHFRLLGALEFVKIFRTLAETPQVMPTVVPDGLNRSV